MGFITPRRVYADPGPGVKEETWGAGGARLRPACGRRFWFSRPNSRISRITQVQKIDERVGRSTEQAPSTLANVQVTETSETSPARAAGHAPRPRARHILPWSPGDGPETPSPLPPWFRCRETNFAAVWQVGVVVVARCAAMT